MQLFWGKLPKYARSDESIIESIYKGGNQIMKNNYMDSKNIAVHYSYPLCEIRAIINGLDDYIIFYSIVDCKMHQSKIKYTTKGDPYFNFSGRRVKLDECYRV